MRARTFFSCILVLSCIRMELHLLDAQTLPETDVYVARLFHRDGTLALDSLRNMTHRPGYDNQPSFLSDGRSFLFTEYLDNQSDIFQCSPGNDSLIRLTETRESEYSPTLTPDGKHFSVVQVEKDSTQRLWQFPLAKGQGAPELLVKTIRPVGYQAWIDSATIALFILGDTNTLHIVTMGSERDEKIPGEIGRSLHKTPGRRSITFVTKRSDKEWWISEYDLDTRKVTSLARTLPGREDFAWGPDGLVLMGDGAKLFACAPGRDRAWHLVADCSGSGISQITRLAVNAQGDRIAIVGTAEPSAK